MTTTTQEHFIELAFADGTAARWAVTLGDLTRAADLIEAELDTPGLATTTSAPRPESTRDAGYVELTNADRSVRHWAVTEDEADHLAEALESCVGVADTLMC